MYNQLDIGVVEKNTDNEPYGYIYNISNYNCYDIKTDLINPNADMYNMRLGSHLTQIEIINTPTIYELHVIINKYTGNEIKYLKNSNTLRYSINLLTCIDDKNEKILGLEYNNNKYYIKSNTKKLKDYNNTIKDKLIDKASISEMIHDSFKYYWKIVCGYFYKPENYELLNSFDQY